MNLLPEKLRNNLVALRQETEDYSTMTLILAIGYGGQEEIVRGVRKAIEAGIRPEDITETSFLKFLDTGSFPPPDLIVRTG